MTSAKPQDEPKQNKPGPEPDRLVIPEEDASAALQKLLGVEEDDPDEAESVEDEPEAES